VRCVVRRLPATCARWDDGFVRAADGEDRLVDQEHFSCDARRDGDTIVATLAGELDMPATFRLEPELERLTQQPGVRSLVLDMGAVEFIDSAGLGALLASHDRLRAVGIRFVLTRPSPAVARILHLTGARDTLRVNGEPERPAP
jgi:anti-sigma B factor antagonist